MSNLNRTATRVSHPFQSLLDSFFVDSLPEVFPGPAAPATDIAESPEALIVSVALPGVEDADIHLDIHDGRLTVTADRKSDPLASTEGVTWHRREQRIGTWSRTVLLPDNVNPEAVEAVYRHGVLRVTIQKHPKSKPVRVQIKSS